MANENFVEKVSVNVNSSTLSSVDLLVDNGYYSNRSDFINQAMRREVERQQPVIERIISQESRVSGKDDQWFIGVCGLEARYISELYAQGRHITMKGYGVLVIGTKVDPLQLYQVVDAITVKGRTIASAEIKEHYGLR